MKYTPATPNLEPQETLDGLSDVREDTRTKDLKNLSRTRTRAGHIIEFNDNQGVEHITFQHRSGSLLQMQPDGSVRLVSNGGKMGIEINGEGYVKITGAYNVVVDGGASFKVAKNCDWHVNGDMTMTVDGKFTTIAKSVSTIAEEKVETTATSISSHATESYGIVSAGKVYVGADNAMKIESGAGMTLVDTTGIDLNPS